MNFDDVNDDNFIIFAMKFYENQKCLSEKDFHNDLKILKYIKRLLNRYKKTGEIKTRLMLNHLIMLGNVFPIEILVRILFLKIPHDYWKELKTFLIFLKYMPERVGSVNGKYILSSDIEVDFKIVEDLRKI